MKDINSKIAELVLRAQNASDGGKDICKICGSRKSHKDNLAGYSRKDPAIFSAINLINTRKSNFKYSVQYCDSFKNPCWIVYFETRINLEKFQISFHTFDRRFSRFENNSFRIKWNKKRDPEPGCSRDCAIRVYEWYVPNGHYY